MFNLNQVIMKVKKESNSILEQLQDNKLDVQELLTIRGGDGPEIDPDPEPIIVTEDG